MNKKLKTFVNPPQASTIFLVLAIFIASLIRLNAILKISFPITDGGLFFKMTQELINEHFKIPQFTAYNHLQIPYAYPPLGFYFSGILSEIIGWDLLNIFRILPVIFSILAIPAFYLLAKTILEDEFSIGVSILIFSLLPTTIDWLIMGGGITRSPGFVFSILALRSGYLLFDRKKKIDIFLTTIFSSLTILFHPEAAIHTAAGIFVFFLYKGRNKGGLINSGIVFLAILLITSPWWFQVVKYHGFSPFFAAGKTGMHNVGNYLNYLLFNITLESGLTSIGVLALVGIFANIAKKQTILPVWFLITFLAAPRTASLFLSPIIALLSGGVLTVIINKFDCIKNIINDNSLKRESLSSLVSKIFLTMLIFHWIYSSSFYMNELAKYILPGSDFLAMSWIKEQTPAESEFLILSGVNPSRDPLSEWFPAITNRTSIATHQGHEWIENTDFEEILYLSNMLQQCIFQKPDCVTDLVNSYELDYDFIYLRKQVINLDEFEVPIYAWLIEDDEFEVVYENDSVCIYKQSELINY